MKCVFPIQKYLLKTKNIIFYPQSIFKCKTFSLLFYVCCWLLLFCKFCFLSIFVFLFVTSNSVKNKFWFFESTLYKCECYNLLVWFLVSIFIESCTDGFKSWFINKRIRKPSLMTIRVVKCTRSKDQLFCNFNGFMYYTT